MTTTLQVLRHRWEGVNWIAICQNCGKTLTLGHDTKEEARENGLKWLKRHRCDLSDTSMVIPR